MLDFKRAKIKIFSDLSPITLAKLQSFRPITSHLQNHEIMYHWGFPFRLSASREGVQHSMRDLQEWSLPPQPGHTTPSWRGSPALACNTKLTTCSKQDLDPGLTETTQVHLRSCGVLPPDSQHDGSIHTLGPIFSRFWLCAPRLLARVPELETLPRIREMTLDSGILFCVLVLSVQMFTSLRSYTGRWWGPLPLLGGPHVPSFSPGPQPWLPDRFSLHFIIYPFFRYLWSVHHMDYLQVSCIVSVYAILIKSFYAISLPHTYPFYFYFCCTAS